MTYFKYLTQSVSLLLALVLIHGCSTQNNHADSASAAASDLVVSVQDLYWGTRDVGLETTQMLTLSNQGQHTIRINRVGLSGVNASEFKSSLKNSITLQTGESVDVAVSFAPVSEGRKYASLDIDFDQI